jgi:uncharacterized protein with FMN-binding domain
MKNIWKYAVGLVLVVLVAGYILFGRQGSETASPDVVNPPAATTTDTTPAPTGAATGIGNGTGSGSAAGGGAGTDSTGGSEATGLYKDGTYTGTAADAFYGTIQVEAVVSGGQLTDVTFLQYPNAPGHTSDVSNTALPQLKQEAITAQSANVNVVSGATQDSQAFQQSLASALAQAKS